MYLNKWESLVQGPPTVLENKAKAIQGTVWSKENTKSRNKYCLSSLKHRRLDSTLLMCMCLGTSTSLVLTSSILEMALPSSLLSSTWPPSWSWSRRKTCWPSSGPDLTSAESGSSVAFPPGFFMNTRCSSEGDTQHTSLKWQNFSSYKHYEKHAHIPF